MWSTAYCSNLLTGLLLADEGRDVTDGARSPVRVLALSIPGHRYRLASTTRLNGVFVAIRNLEKPLLVTTSSNAAGPA